MDKLSREIGGLLAFDLSSDIKDIALTFDMPDFSFSGTVGYVRDKTPPHCPCDPSTSGSLYFESLAQNEQLNPSETLLYTETGWALVMPRATVTVSVNVGGTQFSLVGTRYHDWAPHTLDTYIHTWLTNQGSCGPFDLAIWRFKPWARTVRRTSSKKLVCV
jgi:hypothetical protein